MLVYYINQSLWITLLILAPVVGVTIALGLIIGFLQAIFQLQDQALPFGIKLLAVSLVLFALGSWQSGLLINFMDTMLNILPTAGKTT
ncbi:MAG: EscS/YscS/HrcS family type III secretion system export apparatus protein [Limnobacter sp.]|nr:EscS/YscS/HrcS family type III secretion system export apparatus protein [Limnobacter sp.]